VDPAAIIRRVIGERLPDARRALLGRLIDHAPTFPPARLPPDEALAEDRRVREGDDRWIAGRLVWSASRLAELRGCAGRVPLSVVLDGPVPGSDPEAWPIEAVETRWPAVPDFGGEVFVELPIDADLPDNLERVKAAGAFAKVRCGGARTPSVEELARFVRACAVAQLPFKATAGLHHPVRGGESHGFLNLLAAVLFPLEAERALAVYEPAAFSLDERRFAWEGFEAGPAEITRARRDRFRSFGSCSFREPVDELRELGFL
jgi:hypothetical protein